MSVATGRMFDGRDMFLVVMRAASVVVASNAVGGVGSEGREMHPISYAVRGFVQAIALS